MVKQLLALTLALNLLQPVCAQDSMWKTFYDQAAKATAIQNFVEAEKLFNSALKSLDEGAEGSDEQRILIYEQLGFVLQQEGKFAESEAVYRKEMAICEKKFGAEDPIVANILASLGRLYSIQQKYLEASTLLKQAATLMEKKFGKDSVERARIVTSLAENAKRDGKYADAEALYAESQAVFEKKLGADDTSVIQSLTHRAFLAVDQLKSADAEKLMKQAVALSEKKLGKDNIETGISLVGLATIYTSMGKYDLAEPLAKQSLAIFEKVGGPDSVYCLVSLNSLVLIASNARKFEEATALNKRVLAIVEKHYGPKHQASIMAIRSLAWVQYNQKNFPESQLLLEKALAMQESSPEVAKTSIAATLWDLANCYEEQQNFIDSEATYRKLLDLDRERYGESNASVAADLDCLARVLTALGKADEAAKMTRQSLTIKKTLPGSKKISEATAPVSIASKSSDANRPVKDKWALVVGISNFQDPELNLQYAAKDATDFRNYLVNEGHFQPDHVKLLTDEQATRDNIVGNLGEKWLGRLANPDDLVVVYISSHGSAPADDAKGTNFIVSYETNVDNLVLTGIPMQWLTAGVSKMVHCDRMVIVLDVCHAGAVKTSEKGLTRQPMFHVNEQMLGKGQVLLASSDADQTSYESKNYKNGVFTYRLLEGLRKEGDKTRLTEACDYLRSKVQEEVLRDRAKLQTPVVMNNWKGADVVLGVIPAEPRSAELPTKEANSGSTK